VLNCLLLANVMAEEGKPLGQLVADLQREFGAHYYGRRDLHIAEEIKQGAIQRARADDTRKLGRYAVLKKENLDGIKFFLDAPTNGNGAEAWILFRASGTEPLLRAGDCDGPTGCAILPTVGDFRAIRYRSFSIYLLFLLLISKVLGMGLDYYGFRLETQLPSSRHKSDSLRGLWDEVKGISGRTGVGSGILVELLYFMIRQSPQHWWLLAWALFMGLFILLAQLAPVVSVSDLL
jgi:hypothetical protein